ncbi:MAG: DNA polymerase III subunit beta [Candidatus Paceibacterota bacterium]
MKLKILKQNLKQGLDKIKKVASKSSSLPVLDSVLLTTKKNHLELAATDLELGIKYEVLAKIKDQGKVAIPAKAFSNLINSLPEEEIQLKQKKQDLKIKCGNYESQLKGLDPKEFPIIPELEDEFAEIKSSVLMEGLSQVEDIASPSKVRPEISGVYICFNKKEIKMVATDSFRLGEKTVSLSDTTLDSTRCLILPSKTARELMNIFKDQQRELKVFISENQIMFKTESPEKTQPEFQITSKLVEGDYPDYEKIIPDDHQTRLKLPREKFLNQIKAASLFGGKVNEVKCKTSDKGLEISSEDPNLGKNKSVVSAEVEGEDSEASFNWRFVRDGLSNINTDQVIFEMNGGEGAATLRPDGDESYLYVIMPIKST